mmetsp:Transcript_16122/g.34844  ORF Transcript_16122/g.34844 Transcript_16122/m.34844 type:complete len:504 (+) Transcript_16122:99-1610(+)
MVEKNKSVAGRGESANGGDAGGELRQVRLPAGWEGLSLKLDDVGRLIVSEVPKACFSSASFGAAGARPQVDGVSEGDEIATLNGETPARAIERIMSKGDSWNACTSADPPHEPGSKGKFDSPPCPACDFNRRKNQLGLDVAFQMWLRAVKRDMQFTLGVRKPTEGACGSLLQQSSSQSEGSQTENKPPRKAASLVDLSATSSVTGAISELKSLDEHRDEAKEAKGKGKNGQKTKGKGKGKDKGQGKGKGKDANGKKKKRKPSGPDLPRERVTQEKVSGTVTEWKGKFGWVKPLTPLDHPLSKKHKGRLYLHVQDLEYADAVAPGTTVWFHVFFDASGLGAEECVAEGEEEWDEQHEWDEDMVEEDGWWSVDENGNWLAADGSTEWSTQGAASEWQTHETAGWSSQPGSYQTPPPSANTSNAQSAAWRNGYEKTWHGNDNTSWQSHAYPSEDDNTAWQSRPIRNAQSTWPQDGGAVEWSADPSENWPSYDYEAQQWPATENATV